MRSSLKVLRALSYIGLVLTLLPALLVFGDAIDLRTYRWIMLGGTLLYLATAPFWINHGDVS